MAGHLQPGNLLDEQMVSHLFAAIGEITGDDATLGIAVMATNVVDATAETLGWIQTTK